MSDKATEITNSNFNEIVEKSTTPVLVDFWAEWCNPCRMIAPVVDEIAQAYEGKVVVGKVNIDEQGELAQRFGVMSIPTLILFKDGKPAQKSVGVVGKDRISSMIDSVL